MHPLRRAAKLALRFSGCDLHNAVKGAYLRRVEALLAAEVAVPQSSLLGQSADARFGQRSTMDAPTQAAEATTGADCIQSAYTSCCSSSEQSSTDAQNQSALSLLNPSVITEVDLLVSLCQVRSWSSGFGRDVDS